jgi:hypothetical protein
MHLFCLWKRGFEAQARIEQIILDDWKVAAEAIRAEHARNGLTFVRN